VARAHAVGGLWPSGWLERLRTTTKVRNEELLMKVSMANYPVTPTERAQLVENWTHEYTWNLPIIFVACLSFLRSPLFSPYCVNIKCWVELYGCRLGLLSIPRCTMMACKSFLDIQKQVLCLHNRSSTVGNKDRLFAILLLCCTAAVLGLCTVSGEWNALVMIGNQPKCFPT